MQNSMKLEFKKQQILTLIILAVLFGSSSITNLGSSEIPLDSAIEKLRYVLILTALMTLLLLSRFDIWGFPKKQLPLIIVWILLGFISVISGVVNDDLVSVRDGLWFMIISPMIFFYSLPKLMKQYANFLLATSLFLGLLPYIVMSLLLHPINQFQGHSDASYAGVFPNPNDLGFTSVTMASGLFIILIGSLSAKKRLWYILPIILCLIFLFVIIILANARTSLIAFFGMLSIFMWRLFQKSGFLIKFVNSIALSISAILLLADEQFYLFFLNNLNQLQDKDGLSGREYIWNKTFEDVKLLGNGADYFELNFGLGGHNTIINTLGTIGIIAAFLMLFLASLSIFYAYLYFKTHSKTDHYAIAPLVITICFWITSMGEGMFSALGTAMTVAYFLCIGIIVA